ncbi:putative host factor I protein [Rubidibacter lacunae KORDI 51-2]|uniref:Putative host factor I protein n=1 Tax=Rubidibacter lacunae KORDI 51-2 TaxID=582515 RepID=U5DEA9_9CHRO|nr:RNA chaperone Hfq [Rubidibacter lacunae]ERN39961.1 putative host factor I protein [Rubidibacter lacunae KORDI 51-2]
MPEFDTGLPSTRFIQTLIRDKQSVEIQLLVNNKLSGTVAWQDTVSILLNDSSGKTVLIWKQAIATIAAGSNLGEPEDFEA